MVGWQYRAKCRGLEPSIFFNDEFQTKPSNSYRRICAECPVISECLEYALVYNLQGVWGGTTDRDRRRIPQHKIDMLRDDYRESGLYDDRLKA